MDQLKDLAARALEIVQAFRTANRQLFNLIAAACAVALTTCALLYLLDPGAPVVLANNLSLADRSALALRLRRQRIDFTLGPDSITVPSNQIPQARSVLDGSPGFSGGGDDFGLFDRSTMGESDFDEQVNYQRSLQGEIERTLMDIHGVDNARVMLAMGNSSGLGLEPVEAERASVLLTIAPGTIVDNTMARAIAHLVAGSVRGLSAENVTISSNDGTILYPPQREGELGEAMRLRNDFERRLQEKVSALLTRIMGENRYAVEVAVDVDTSRVSSHDNLYGKGDQAVLSEERSLTPAVAQIGGIPGLTSNLPGPSPSPGPSPTAKSTARAPVPSPAPVASKYIINYKPSSRQIRTVTAPVRIKQITVAAVLDGTYEEGRFRPLPQERLSAIKDLLAAAVGAEAQRGDSVEVQSAALSQPYVPPVPNPITELRVWLNDPVHMFTAGAAVLIALVLILWVTKRTLSKVVGGRGKDNAASVEASVQPATTGAAIVSLETVVPDSPPSGGEFEAIRSQLNQQIERDPAAAAELLRRWLAVADTTPSHAQNGSSDQ